MVLGSELAFRMLVRQHGINLCYTPMIKADRLVANDQEEMLLLETCQEDRPLVVQLCGRDPDVLSEAVLVVLRSMTVDAFDLNLGCPQECAELGRYGAFLQDEPAVAVACVGAMRKAATPLPVFCKTRIFESTQESVRFALSLEAAGCAALAIHCRTRACKHGGAPDYDQLISIVAALRIPVVANGDISSVEQGKIVMEKTGAAAVMSATPLLRCPRAFGGQVAATPVDLAFEYLDFASRYPPPSPLYVRKHLRWIFRSELEAAYLDSMQRCRGAELPSDWANVCHRYFREGSCGAGAKCRWRHVQNPMALAESELPQPEWECHRGINAGAEAWEDTALNWRARAWTFLVRPYLQELWQFREVVRLVACYLGQVLPASDCMISSGVPSFRGIRTGQIVDQDGTEDEDEASSLNWLFDSA